MPASILEANNSSGVRQTASVSQGTRSPPSSGQNLTSDKHAVLNNAALGVPKTWNIDSAIDLHLDPTNSEQRLRTLVDARSALSEIAALGFRFDERARARDRRLSCIFLSAYTMLYYTII